jgi:hypothetical protein
MFATSPRLTPVTGGKLGSTESAPSKPEFRGIGVLYAKDNGETVEFRVVYLAGLPQDIKDIVAELFGAGALEWKVCAK